MPYAAPIPRSWRHEEEDRHAEDPRAAAAAVPPHLPQEGGGQKLQEEIYKTLNLDVVSYLYGPMPTQPLGWFKKPIAKPEDLKGLKFRTVGLSIDIFTGLGCAVNALPGAEIVPAMDRGLLDAAEFNNASSDKALGFPDVSKICMLQSFHQSAEQFEIIFNRKKFDSLSPKLKA